MTTRFLIFGSTAVRSVSGLTCAASLWLGVCFPSAAADRALGFNGAAQHVEVPLGATIVVDDQEPRFLATPAGSWSASNSTNAYGSAARQTPSATATARWTPLLTRAGAYQVYTWSGGPPAGRDPAAQYVIKHATGITTNVHNQTTNWNGLTPLGTFDFNANREEFVALHPSGTGTAVADAVMFANEQAFDLAQSATLEAWVKATALDQPWQAIIAKGDAWGLAFSSNRIVFHTRDSLGNPHDLASSHVLVTNRWYHVAVTFDGNRKLLYLNGALAGSALWQASLATNQYPVWFGGNAETSSNYFKGELDNVRLWSLVRSQTELQTCTNRNLRGTETGLLGEWRFDDIATNLMSLDSSAAALHGMLRKTDSPPTNVAGMVCGVPLPGSLALRFNGYNQYVAVSNTADTRFDFAHACTIETWVYCDFAPRAPVSLVSKGTNAWDLAINENGKIVFHTDGVAPNDLLSKTRLDPGGWHHVAAVWDGLEKRIYLNGLLDATATGLAGQMSANTNCVHLAARPGSSGRDAFFEGLLDEVRLWNVARQPAQVYGNFGRDLNATQPGLAGFWKFDEGADSTVFDRSPAASPAPGTLLGGEDNLNRVPGRVLGSALPLQYCVALNGLNEFVDIGAADLFDLTNLTIEAWVKPTGTNFKTILMKGVDGYGLAIDGNNYLRYFTDGTTQNSLRSTRPLSSYQDTQGHAGATWSHVSVVVDRAANTTTFYINGQPAGSYASSTIQNNSGALVLGKQGGGLTNNCFQGQMDEVRLWNVARSSVEIDLYALTPLLGTRLPGLVGYWTFNEGVGTTVADHSGGDHNGTLNNMDANTWLEGTDWGLPALPGGLLSAVPNPDAAGLWIGQVVLSKINEVQKATGGADEILTETGHPASFRLLLHVGADGQVRMLKDVIVMKKPGSTNAPANSGTNPIAPVELSAPATNLVLVTRPELIPNFEGVMKRGGKLVGLRYGTAAYDFDGTSLPLLGGIGPSTTCLGRINLSKDHPTNPYRHKYHPDHRSGFTIVRQVTMQFDGAPGDPWQESPGYGMDRLTGVYRETVVGLHKIPLLVEGTVRLDRVNSVKVLDDGL